jgi:serine/threonine protein kinase
MEDRKGATLADEMSKAPFSVPELLRRAIGLATALNRLHRKGRVHGSFGPDSIILTPAGVELIEPGDTGAAHRPITPYTAPEQFREIVDARSDIFAFGALIYEMATGRKAFVGDTPVQLEAAILEDEPPSITSLRQDPPATAFYTALDRLVVDCLVKNPEQRRQRVHNALVDLKLLSSAARAAEPKIPPKPAPAPAREEAYPQRETQPIPLGATERATTPAGRAGSAGDSVPDEGSGKFAASAHAISGAAGPVARNP